jgi:hypothetical protein
MTEVITREEDTRDKPVIARKAEPDVAISCPKTHKLKKQIACGGRGLHAGNRA